MTKKRRGEAETERVEDELYIERMRTRKINRRRDRKGKKKRGKEIQI